MQQFASRAGQSTHFQAPTSISSLSIANGPRSRPVDVARCVRGSHSSSASGAHHRSIPNAQPAAWTVTSRFNTVLKPLRTHLVLTGTRRHRNQPLVPPPAASHSQAWLDSILSEAEYFKAYYGNLDAFSETIKDARWAGLTAARASKCSTSRTCDPTRPACFRADLPQILSYHLTRRAAVLFHL